MIKQSSKFLVCTRNDGCADLALRKVYETMADEEATAEGYLRVVDDSGECYLYPAEYFVAIELTREAAEALRRAF